MEISKSLFAATLVSATLLTGAVAYAASSGVIDGRDDNVGNLQPTAQNPAVTVVVDPTSTRASTSTTRTSTSTASTASTTTRRPDVTAATAGTAPTSTIDDHGGDRHDNSGSGSDDDDDDNSGSGSSNSGSGSGDDRRHGRGGDDD